MFAFQGSSSPSGPADPTPGAGGYNSTAYYVAQANGGGIGGKLGSAQGNAGALRYPVQSVGKVMSSYEQMGTGNR